jgi:hypothetical protein
VPRDTFRYFRAEVGLAPPEETNSSYFASSNSMTRDSTAVPGAIVSDCATIISSEKMTSPTVVAIFCMTGKSNTRNLARITLLLI